MNNLWLTAILVALISSCATREAPLSSTESSDDIVDVFQTQDERFERFRVVRDEPDDTPISVPEKKPVPSAGPQLKAPRPSLPIAVKPAEPKESEVEPPIMSEILEDIAEMEEGGIEFTGDEIPEIFQLYDYRSKKVWETYKPRYFPGEEKRFAIKYLGLTAGHVTIQTRPMARINDRPVMHFMGHMRSARFYEYLYRLDDSIETYVDAHSQVPLRYTLIQRESGQDVDDLQVFDHEKNKTYHWYKRIKNNQTREEEKEAFVPDYFQDSFSALFFARGLPYQIGDVYEFPIVTRAKLWILKMEVERVETIRIMRERVPAYRVRAETRFPGVLEKRGDIIFWFSADEKRRLLRFRASVKIGAVEGELIEYKPGIAVTSF
jgi:hypothetical protein